METTQFKGQIAGFPTEVVEKMLTRQEEQGNKRDFTIFERNKGADIFRGGFDWVRTIEGKNFWELVIKAMDFDKFFEKYPKAPEPYWFGGDYDRGEEVKWHDLRRNTEDLPPHEYEASICSLYVLIYTIRNAYDIAHYNFNDECWITNSEMWLDDCEVIAWREMPKFMEE